MKWESTPSACCDCLCSPLAIHSSCGGHDSQSLPILPGYRQAQITRAEGEKAAAVLVSEAQRDSAMNLADGDAGATRAAAQARADATLAVAAAFQAEGGDQAARYALASEYIAAFGKLGGRSSTLVVPADAASVPSVLTQAMAAMDGMRPQPAK